MAFEEVERRVRSLQPPTMTIGDEFQALYRRMGDALTATLWLSVILTGSVDIRLGIGWGPLELQDPGRTPFGQDGPCWWRARAAVDFVSERQHRYGVSRNRRTAVRTGEPDSDVFDSLVALRDEVVAGLDETDAAIMRDMADGSTQQEIAERLGLHRSSVSRRATSKGILTLLDTVGASA